MEMKTADDKNATALNANGHEINANLFKIERRQKNHFWQNQLAVLKEYIKF